MNYSVRRVLPMSRIVLRSYATVTAKPNDIPFQPKLANSVNLIGHVQSPIQFHVSPNDGYVWASTVITRQDSSDLSFSIPVIFEGDLAHTAKFHLNLNDCIHIAGKLTTDSPQLEHLHPQSNIQVMVQTLNFVQRYPQPNTTTSIDLKPQPQPEHSIPSAKKNPDSSSPSPWRDLLDNPMQWRDFRESKRNGLVKPKHPDFKRKDGYSLWLGKDEKWVLPKLEELQFDVPTAISKKGDGGESWNDLVQNYANWWDNRLNKRNAKAPDFKHKETGKGLWLDSSSEWVLEKLPPPLKPKQSVDTERTLVS
ncbi:hypothetical protein JHK82_018413 [Glycine max]|uniref:Protein OSB2, chloroplastic isoform A n=1 Tax=Glycine soja TaxID=3848 RepID=A0A445JW51_GLYSO|nr:protein OSB3, chloroplastic/mitochondrial isoform X1 [Glycine soja]KAG5037600.1 hypothetical protein JHK86_018440 [Glycine max]KAG5142718.1 hypothetical protein JHK82_018413 [Glycine max]KAH1241805.1 Protein OSB2, chloroplastic [Glycine max]RZC02727.1 Protein OSB2, chloroplastic isoform A [Glycine soja]